jgi:hypothetical protein
MAAFTLEAKLLVLLLLIGFRSHINSYYLHALLLPKGRLLLLLNRSVVLIYIIIDQYLLTCGVFQTAECTH